MFLSARNLLCVFFISFVWVSRAAGAPTQPIPAGQPDPEEAGMEEGDMVLTEGQKAFLKNPIQSRNGLVDETKRWPNRLVYYKIVGLFDIAHRRAILDGIATLEAHTCIKFQEADASQTNYVAISSNAGGCYTAVGYQAKVQEMNLEIYPLGEGCFRVGTVLHEFMHALGFYHEQSAADRDDYIEVLYDNIIPEKKENFKKFTSKKVTNFGVGYDYQSCLHYRPGAFSINGEDTIVPLDPTAQIGQRSKISKKDIDKINVMYKCPIKI